MFQVYDDYEKKRIEKNKNYKKLFNTIYVNALKDKGVSNIWWLWEEVNLYEVLFAMKFCFIYIYIYVCVCVCVYFINY